MSERVTCPNCDGTGRVWEFRESDREAGRDYRSVGGDCDRCSGRGQIEAATDGGRDTDEQTQACPECDSSAVRPHNSHGRNAEPTDHAWSCGACGATFDEPVEREKYQQSPHSGLARKLVDADPDDVLTDGGRTTTSTEELAHEIRTIRASSRDGETLLTRLRHYWCYFGPGEYPDEREEIIVDEQGDRIGKRWVCTRCGQPVSFVAGPIELDAPAESKEETDD